MVTLASALVKQKALEVGFDLCGIAPAAPHPKLARLASWIAEGRAGSMAYLGDSLDERLDVRRVLPTARTVISLACAYHTDAPLSTETPPGQAAISRYAWGDDYHEVLKARVRQLLTWMAEAAGRGLEAISSVDDGPVQERVFAEAAGLGWIGKNTCLIHPRLGSWIFLAAVITNADIETDRPTTDHCGTCTRCIEACPTGAITEAWTVDARRCLSYLTIESRPMVETPLRPFLQTHIYGCDVCQDVCPWNSKAPPSTDPAWRARDGLTGARIVDLARLSDAEWSARLRGSAMRRAGLRRLRRSLALACASLPPAEGAEGLAAIEAQPSADHPDVREAIAWARDQLRERGAGASSRPPNLSETRA
jgi:epoxyqueuosine reductase